MGILFILNLGGEGEVPGAVNQQPPFALEPNWRSVRGETFLQLANSGIAFLICPNGAIPLLSNTVDEVCTNNVPVDVTTFRGLGVQSSEIWRILKSGGRWVRDGVVVFTKP